MRRLTEKYSIYSDIDHEKLQALEDIEEELGIDLITLFKALKNGIYANGYEKFMPNLVYFPRGFFAFAHNLNNRSVLYFKDHGKTWALTKEELEKGD